ncbi:uncharacterized protein LOC126887823 [Diabrotica virgifera virgifera]|uniref:ribonuclease H n=1 Tax=Diabrotica virgifera virgifera TaxID=50390 RepID=A0ABM5KN83_DIAVI|nr:uncharacterized protein LOC126887823 [Diabrotica virgifera virgifera]
MYSHVLEEIFSKQITTFFMDINLNPAVFQSFILHKWPHYQFYYTDGSKVQNKVGCAIINIQSGFKKLFKLPCESSIYTAEMIAILFALRHIFSNEPYSCIIFTDSKSAVDRLTNVHKYQQLDHIELEIMTLYNKIANLGKNIIISWIKGHAGIRGNEIVDRLAKSALEIGEELPMNLLPISDIDIISRRHQKENWQRYYRNTRTGSNYKQMRPEIPIKRWFHSVSNRHFIRVINGLRCNHALTPIHMYSLGLTESPNCECGKEGNLLHILLECSHQSVNINKFYDNLNILKIPLPVYLNNLIFSEDINILKTIYEHIKNCKYRL